MHIQCPKNLSSIRRVLRAFKPTGNLTVELAYNFELQSLSEVMKSLSTYKIKVKQISVWCHELTKGIVDAFEAIKIPIKSLEFN